MSSEDNGSTGLATTSTSGPDTEDVATTIPLPPMTSSTGAEDTAGDTTDGGTETSSETEAVDSSDGGTTGSDSSGTSSGDEDSSSDSGAVTYDIGWCILQFPAVVAEPVGTPFTIYMRVFAEGLTDQTGATDPAPELVAELGWGPDGSDPSMGDEGLWTWTAAMPNPGYGPGAPDYSAANDEYWGDLTIGVAGTHDFATRVSGDAGATWHYCDLDGLTEGGYTPGQAGDAQMGEPR